jgi:hypothetical protein
VLARRRRSDTGSIGELFGGLRPPIYQGDQNARAGLVNKERTYTDKVRLGRPLWRIVYVHSFTFCICDFWPKTRALLLVNTPAPLTLSAPGGIHFLLSNFGNDSP